MNVEVDALTTWDVIAAGDGLFLPRADAPRPGLLVLHGSEGADAGIAARQAAFFASRGFVAWAFPYFGQAGTPPHLADIEVGAVVAALEDLAAHAAVRGEDVGVFGSLRGAELALLVAACAAERPAGAIRPRAVAVHAVTRHVAGPYFGPGKGEHVAVGGGNERRDGRAPLPTNAWRWGGVPLATGTPLPLDRIACPVFVSHACDDDVWPVAHAHEVAEALSRREARCHARLFPGEGHVMSAEGYRALFAEITAFFREELRGARV